MAPVVTVSMFEEWCYHHINGYLGKKKMKQQNGTAQLAPQGLKSGITIILIDIWARRR
jgi:hypothetical protein